MSMQTKNKYGQTLSAEERKAKSPLGIYEKAAVAADNGACSEIGNAILRKGGNAVESVIATAICIGVMDPHSAGLGGGHFLTIYNKQSKSCTILDARERAPFHIEDARYQNDTKLIQTGWIAVAVPGEIHGFWTAYQRYGGNVPWKDLWTPTIDICRKGMSISPAVAKILRDYASAVKSSPYLSDFIDEKTGQPRKEGEMMKFPKLADTMEKLANSKNPVQLFYDSEWTDRMIDEFRTNGGVMTREDFRNYTSRLGVRERPPIYAKLRNNLTFCSPPPPSSGGLSTSIISTLDAFDMTTVDKSNRTAVAQLFHRFLEATKFAYGIRNKLGDMDFVDSAYQSVDSANYPTYARYIRQKITDKSMTDPLYYGAATVKWDHGTAHMSVVDQYGNAASLTSSINL
uniref:Gamma-glutamyltransferase n=1 Tax=Romanomermis culicivorax TaxID=13658 RepID=A0A915IRU5_ROMCU